MSTKSLNADIMVWLGTAIGSVGIGGAGVLSSVGHVKPAIWIGYVSALAYIVAILMYVIRKRPVWKTRAKLISVVVAAILLTICVWLHQSIAPPQPTMPPVSSITVESLGNQSPNIVGNEGTVTINNQQTTVPSNKIRKQENNIK